MLARAVLHPPGGRAFAALRPPARGRTACLVLAVASRVYGPELALDASWQGPCRWRCHPPQPTVSSNEGDGEAASERIDRKVAALNDWPGETLSRIRKLIKEAEPEVVEEVKWGKPSSPEGVSIWSHDGMICTGEMYESTVKLTFAKGASLEDPLEQFNSSLGGRTRRAIDLREGETLDPEAFKALVRAAVDL